MLTIFRKQFLPLFLVLLSSLLNCMAFAGTISITSTLKFEEKDGKKILVAQIKNSGNESAQDVQAHIQFLDMDLSGPKWESLGAGKEEIVSWDLPVMSVKNGRYPAVLTVEFSDLNSYPFSAVNVRSLEIGQADPPRVFGKLDSVSITNEGEFNFMLKNLEPVAKKIKVTLVRPKEINIEPGEFELELGETNAPISKTIKVSNFSALPGAIYPIFAIVAYDSETTHDTIVLRSNIQMSQDSNSYSTLIWLLGLVAIFLLIFWLLTRKGKSQQKN
ncbi:MAG: hypothetical protein GYA55_11460 [SAR324 cluster bacterium]|uniref:CARDB domain-containing protein n=1 Tax=SAR324 cluster bacterium TaxID=2024889 RepID=A0A7X9FT10_9DELT|nr:hypothetical protein [SAR324 cluster bacterium]